MPQFTRIIITDIHKKHLKLLQKSDLKLAPDLEHIHHYYLHNFTGSVKQPGTHMSYA